MKVLYVSKALISAAYRDKLRALADHVDVRAVIPHRWGRHAVEPLAQETVPIQLVPAIFHGHNHLHLYRHVGRLLDDDRPDLVHIDEEPYSAVSYQLARACAQRAIPCVVFAWQNLDKRLPFPFAVLRRAVLKTIVGAIAGTESAAGVLARAGCDKPIAVIPQFGVDPDRFRPDPEARAARRSALSATDDDFVVGFGGRLVREKGVHLLLRSVALLPGVRAVFLGDGPERSPLERAARQAGIADRVRFAGAVPSTEVAGWLPAFDALVLPSLDAPGWREQFGRILIEAMACGVPVAGSDSGEIPNVVGNAGAVFPRGDADALALTLRRLQASPQDRAALGRAGRERVCRQYSQDRIGGATAEFYRSLLRVERQASPSPI